MKDDFHTSNLKNRFEIPDRGLALKKVETCFNSKGLQGFRFYDKQDNNIFEWRFEDCHHTVTTTLKDGERIVDYVLQDKENIGVVNLDFVISRLI
jgi:hypothetical protein